jgi:outer membrane lipoprotein SlyB
MLTVIEGGKIIRESATTYMHKHRHKDKYHRHHTERHQVLRLIEDYAIQHYGHAPTSPSNIPTTITPATPSNNPPPNTMHRHKQEFYKHTINTAEVFNGVLTSAMSANTFRTDHVFEKSAEGLYDKALGVQLSYNVRDAETPQDIAQLINEFYDNAKNKNLIVEEQLCNEQQVVLWDRLSNTYHIVYHGSDGRTEDWNAIKNVMKLDEGSDPEILKAEESFVQAAEIIKSNNPTADINLVGFSLGGAKVNYISAKHPDIITSVDYINPFMSPFQARPIDPSITNTVYRVMNDPVTAQSLLKRLNSNTTYVHMYPLNENEGMLDPHMLNQFLSETTQRSIDIKDYVSYHNELIRKTTLAKHVNQMVEMRKAQLDGDAFTDHVIKHHTDDVDISDEGGIVFSKNIHPDSDIVKNWKQSGGELTHEEQTSINSNARFQFDKQPPTHEVPEQTTSAIRQQTSHDELDTINEHFENEVVSHGTEEGVVKSTFPSAKGVHVAGALVGAALGGYLGAKQGHSTAEKAVRGTLGVVEGGLVPPTPELGDFAQQSGMGLTQGEKYAITHPHDHGPTGDTLYDAFHSNNKFTIGSKNYSEVDAHTIVNKKTGVVYHEVPHGPRLPPPKPRVNYNYERNFDIDPNRYDKIGPDEYVDKRTGRELNMPMGDYS